jgi:8-oxo-dGTP pyrophosphatase MutT (NUDIX family)
VFTPHETKLWLSTLEKRMSSAAVALYTPGGKVLVVKANYKSYWSFPGGVVDAGETPRQAGARETAEEVNISVPPEELKFCLVVDRVSKIAQTYQFTFEHEIPNDAFDAVMLDSSELDEYAIVSREDIIAGDRRYSESTKLWAEGKTGYFEQDFGASLQQDI